MSQVTEHLREMAVQNYGADSTEVETADTDTLAEIILRGIATQKYDVSEENLAGKDMRGLIGVLLENMIVDLLKVDRAKVTPDATFADLGADSLDMVELLMSIEDTFEPFGGMKIADEDANIGTVNEAVDRITQYVNNYLQQDSTVTA
jgi:acyl carrier protein